MEERRTRQRLKDAWNGAEDEIISVIKRCLVTVADECDSIHAANRRAQREVEERFDKMVESIDSLRKTLLTVGGTVVTILVGSAIGVFFTR
jgi:hypothetical protein